MSRRDDFSGIVSTADQTNAVYLPLESLTANVLITDVYARVVLSQVYSYHEQRSLREAYYVFPVPARAAVCGFEMRTDDGRRLKGVVKEISQAKAEYEEALSEGRLTGLLEQFRHDVFAVFLGTILPGSNLTVTISTLTQYVVDLSEDDKPNTVRFQLSSHVGARYGAPPSSILYYGTAHQARLNIVVDIVMPSPIYNVTSLTHNIQHVSSGVPASGDAVSGHHVARVEFTSPDTFLDKDFLLVVQALGLDKPRCFSESFTHCGNSSRSNADGPTTALALTIVPRFDLPALVNQEYIFLIDRSGSMSGSTIDMAKRALVLLMRMLPSDQTTFNIFSFGSTFSSLWSHSQRYNEATLYQATHHVDSMQADMGGTELFGAFSNIIGTRSMLTPTSVFVLTDGYVYDSGGVIDCVRRAVLSAPASAPLRFFTLGVGAGASTDLCEGIAREGNGACSMALQVEDLMLKSARLVEAMQIPNVDELTVDWGVLNQVMQAPYRIPALSPGVRLLVTAIFPNDQAPVQVTLRGRLSNGRQLEYQVPVQPIAHHSRPFIDAFGRSLIPPPLIHTLSAHRLIQDLDGDVWQAHDVQNLSGLSPATKRVVLKELIVQLSTRHQVASFHTAFVAVDTPDDIPPARSDSRPSSNSSRSTKRDSKVSQDSGKSSKNPPPSRPGSKTSNAARGGSDAPQKTSGRGDGVSRASKNSPEIPHTSNGNSNASHSPGHSTTSRPQRGGSEASNASRGGSRASYAQGGPNASHGSHRGSHASKASKDGSQASNVSKGRSQTSKVSRGRSEASQVRNGSPDISTQMPGFFVHQPPLGSPDEILCLPDPLGGDHQIVFTAPPLSQVSVSSIPGRLFLSRLVRRGLSAISAFAGWPVAQNVDVSTIQLSDMSRIQTFRGSFSFASTMEGSLSTIVGIPEVQLRASIPPSVTSSTNFDERTSEAIWATAIAIAFMRVKFPFHSEIWGALQDRADRFGSSECASRGLVFEEVVQQALQVVSS